MQVRVDTHIFREALNKILTVVDKKNTRPILTYTLVNISDDSIQLIATDLEVSAKVIIPAFTQSKGTFCVNAKNLFDILRELPNGEIDLEVPVEENILNLNVRDIHYKLLVYSNEEFPHLSFSNVENEFQINSKQVSEIITKTSYAISNDETRLYLNGIFLQETDSKLRAVATDGHRLSIYDSELNQTQIETLINGIIIPKKGVHELKKISETFPDAILRLSVDDSFMYVSADETYFLSIRLIAREYPKYQAVIPSKTSFMLKTDKDIFLDAVRRIRIMSNEKSNGVRLQVTGTELTLSANHPSLGDARETIAVNYNGNELEIGFNAKYLIDTLSSLEEGEVLFEINNELSPVILKSESLPNYLGVIMPLKL
ncbi:MAG: DNA polymerase III subunit beta [Bacteriovoracaceae bacterium]|jgi:DNA polymerase III subunit beta|nr:DNA polymerase III subunit beta [Bacteriovoracaceae bacterium]